MLPFNQTHAYLAKSKQKISADIISKKYSTGNSLSNIWKYTMKTNEANVIKSYERWPNIYVSLVI